MITLLVMTDGRSMFLEPTLKAVDEQNKLLGPVTRKLIHDDSGDVTFARWLQEKYGHEYEIYSTGRRSGFGGAIISAWKQLQNDDNEWAFHLEDDFVIQEVLPLAEMMTVMDQNPHIVQMAAQRQAWNAAEKEAGGVVQLNPGSYTQRDNGLHRWLEHRNFFTTNPSIYRKTLIDYGWPEGNFSEGKFSHKIFNSDDNLVSGYWGGVNDAPKVRHIGDYRNGAGY